MKQFAIVFSAVLIAMLLSLLAYDQFIVKPRTEAAVQSASVDLSTTREQAQAIAADLDASVKKSVADSQEAMQAQASEADRRRLAVDALMRAQMFRVALTEYYQTNGEWPANAQQAGLESASAYAGGAVTGIEVGAHGVVIIKINNAFTPASQIVFEPKPHATGMVDWRCSVQGSDELRRYLLACKG